MAVGNRHENDPGEGTGERGHGEAEVGGGRHQEALALHQGSFSI